MLCYTHAGMNECTYLLLCLDDSDLGILTTQSKRVLRFGTRCEGKLRSRSYEWIFHARWRVSSHHGNATLLLMLLLLLCRASRGNGEIEESGSHHHGGVVVRIFYFCVVLGCVHVVPLRATAECVLDRACSLLQVMETNSCRP
jgi:hypothetical protein